MNATTQVRTRIGTLLRSKRNALLALGVVVLAACAVPPPPPASAASATSAVVGRLRRLARDQRAAGHARVVHDGAVRGRRAAALHRRRQRRRAHGHARFRLAPDPSPHRERVVVLEPRLHRRRLLHEGRDESHAHAAREHRCVRLLRRAEQLRGVQRHRHRARRHHVQRGPGQRVGRREVLRVLRQGQRVDHDRHHLVADGVRGR